MAKTRKMANAISSLVDELQSQLSDTSKTTLITWIVYDLPKADANVAIQVCCRFMKKLSGIWEEPNTFKELFQTICASDKRLLTEATDRDFLEFVKEIFRFYDSQETYKACVFREPFDIWDEPDVVFWVAKICNLRPELIRKKLVLDEDDKKRLLKEMSKPS